MKRALVVLMIVAATAALWWAGALALATVRMRRAANEQWPGGLGTLHDVAKRFPKQGTSPSALRLIELARRIGIEITPKKKGAKVPALESIGNYVKQQTVRTTPAIEPPPPDAAAWLATHASEIDAIREHLLRSGGVAWPFDADLGFDSPVPNLLGHLHLARVFTTRALQRGSWDDLRAAWVLARSLHARPEPITQLIALAIVRMVNAAAWKMPLPAPSWLREMHAVDVRLLLARSLQYETWLSWRYGERQMPVMPAIPARPYNRASISAFVMHQRETVAQVLAVKACAFDGEAFSAKRMRTVPRWNIFARVVTPNLGSVWTRVQRFHAEREATANALRIRAGESIAPSTCADGVWRYDGARLAFSRNIPPASEADAPMPLTLSVP